MNKLEITMMIHEMLDEAFRERDLEHLVKNINGTIHVEVRKHDGTETKFFEIEIKQTGGR